MEEGEGCVPGTGLHRAVLLEGQSAPMKRTSQPMTGSPPPSYLCTPDTALQADRRHQQYVVSTPMYYVTFTPEMYT